MALAIVSGHPTLVIRRAAYERAGLVRAALDTRLGLTPEEFRVDGGLVALGPIHDEDALGGVVAELEALGLAYFEDFFEVPSNWPEWLRVYVGDGAASGVPGAGPASRQAPR
ncbi:hypothetical protein tb265_14040 [Gemmatimonadetes bacterium T265]|nr:hypothetical protein tb265_14040 [Gemmatimonadetes bacterium T265]